MNKPKRRMPPAHRTFMWAEMEKAYIKSNNTSIFPDIESYIEGNPLTALRYILLAILEINNFQHSNSYQHDTTVHATITI